MSGDEMQRSGARRAKRPDNGHKQMIPYEGLLGDIIRCQGRLEYKIDRLTEVVLLLGRAEKIRDARDMATTQEEINGLKAEIGPMTDAIQALSTAWDAFLAAIEEAKDDPEEIAAVTAAYKAQKESILTMALKGTKPAEGQVPA